MDIYLKKEINKHKRECNICKSNRYKILIEKDYVNGIGMEALKEKYFMVSEMADKILYAHFDLFDEISTVKAVDILKKEYNLLSNTLNTTLPLMLQRLDINVADNDLKSVSGLSLAIYRVFEMYGVLKSSVGALSDKIETGNINREDLQKNVVDHREILRTIRDTEKRIR